METLSGQPYAWAGFGGTFGPLMLFSIFSEKVTRQGAIAGMVSGGSTVILWNILQGQFGGIFNIYELLPAFILSSLVIALVSRRTALNPKIASQHQEFLKELEKIS